jgi:DUF1680 family protein
MMMTNPTKHDYPYQPVPFTQVHIQDAFWTPRIETSCKVTIPYDFEKCEDTGRIDNFAIAGGLMEGEHQGIYFNDSDVFKVIEGAAYSLLIERDAELEAYLDNLIVKIAASQEDDGYLYTIRTINPDKLPVEWVGKERWSRLIYSHELYNVGHMYEAAVAYYEATGKRTLLDVALKNADMIANTFGENGIRDVPGHQEIEMGLVKLYRSTGDEKYLNLAKFFLDERGITHGRALHGAYAQDHVPVVEQREAVGHSVRAIYMYAGMADVAALTDTQSYIDAMHTLWENVVYKKMALTGGLGARHEGEAFGDDYELPNLTAYNETCAAIASIFWNHRLFLLSGQSKYIDVLERTLYNGFLSGVSLDGKSFFYVNPLACDGEYHFNADKSITRQGWFNCSCCPTNVVRLLPSLSGYIYAVRDNALYVNLYIANNATLAVNGHEVKISQETNYPHDGWVKLTVESDKSAPFVLRLRIPGWVNNQPVPGDLYHYIDVPAQQAITVKVDGNLIATNMIDGYVEIPVTGNSHTVELDMPMPVRRVMAHENVTELQNQVAIERGPVVYTFESLDNTVDVLNLTLSDDMEFQPVFQPELLGGVTVLTGAITDANGISQAITAIPYHAWGNRGLSKMNTWVSRQP